MNKFIRHIEGDKAIWAITLLMGLISFLPVYSASSNLVFLYDTGSTVSFLLKHASLLFIGFIIMYGVHKLPYNYFSGLSVLLYPVALLLLIYTAMQGKVIEGANASRWIQLPFVGVSFQTSTFAVIVMLTYAARFLARNYQKEVSFKKSVTLLWFPVALMLLFIFPANFSTAALGFLTVLTLAYVACHPPLHLLKILGIACLLVLLFIITAKAFPEAFPNRVDTWINRVENFASGSKEDNYQSEIAKTAIATGGLLGLGPGKSIQKNFLPQSSSDFIFAIIGEEFGFLGTLFLILLYLLLLFRMVLTARKSSTNFGRILVIGLGISIIFQAFVNMAVAVGLLPVTGQPLPLISAGGTSIWMTCVALGMILSVSANRISKPEENTTASESDSTTSENPLVIFSKEETLEV